MASVSSPSSGCSRRPTTGQHRVVDATDAVRRRFGEPCRHPRRLLGSDLLGRRSWTRCTAVAAAVGRPQPASAGRRRRAELVTDEVASGRPRGSVSAGFGLDIGQAFGLEFTLFEHLFVPRCPGSDPADKEPSLGITRVESVAVQVRTDLADRPPREIRWGERVFPHEHRVRGRATAAYPVEVARPDLRGRDGRSASPSHVPHRCAADGGRRGETERRAGSAVVVQSAWAEVLERGPNAPRSSRLVIGSARSERHDAPRREPCRPHREPYAPPAPLPSRTHRARADATVRAFAPGRPRDRPRRRVPGRATSISTCRCPAARIADAPGVPSTAARPPIPGGGSAAAIVGRAWLPLVAMVRGLVRGSPGLRAVSGRM